MANKAINPLVNNNKFESVEKFPFSPTIVVGENFLQQCTLSHLIKPKNKKIRIHNKQMEKNGVYSRFLMRLNSGRLQNKEALGLFMTRATCCTQNYRVARGSGNPSG